MNFKELEDSLIDVRKAYRLLYLYQKRILDLMQFISIHYSVPFVGGWSKFSNFMPTKGKVKLTHWAWDWLNMYFYEFKFGSLLCNKTTFTILLQSDTGFYESEITNPLDVQNFKPAEESKTRLILLCRKNIQEKSINFLFEKLGDNNIELVEERTTDDISSHSLFIAKSYDLQYFLNEKETIKCLENFKSFVEPYGIKFIERDNKTED